MRIGRRSPDRSVPNPTGYLWNASKNNEYLHGKLHNSARTKNSNYPSSINCRASSRAEKLVSFEYKQYKMYAHRRFRAASARSPNLPTLVSRQVVPDATETSVCAASSPRKRRRTGQMFKKSCGCFFFRRWLRVGFLAVRGKWDFRNTKCRRKTITQSMTRLCFAPPTMAECHLEQMFYDVGR
ncbi:unnamed protein product [Leptosia nina]|uniref:Uncharacterized protein n=1 Tax=Leptosia nina TaxID=320188 RepID=A0AAV1JKL4_9NEOP